MRRVIFWASLFGIVAVVLFAYGSYRVGSRMVAPAPRDVGPGPDDLPLVDISIPDASGEPLSGWLLEADRSCGSVVLMHGIRSNRLSMLDRTRFLFAAGYHVLLFDFQAHGRSRGEHITFGYLESRNAKAATRFMRARFPALPMAVIGSSLGGAAAVLNGAELGADLVIIESVYTSLAQATVNRIDVVLGSLGPLLAPALLGQLKPRLGFDTRELRPIDHVASLGVPLMVIAGNEDRRTKPGESRQLFEAAREPKELWMVEGAAHVDYHRYDPVEYERRVLDFLSAHLNCAAATG